MLTSTIAKTPRYSDAQAHALLARVRPLLTDDQRWQLGTQFRTAWTFAEHHGRVSEAQLRTKDLIAYLAHLEAEGQGRIASSIAEAYSRIAAAPAVGGIA